LDRLAKYQAFKNFSKRILVSTDLFGRGIDIERVNIVFNYDMPESSDTYLHRVSQDVIVYRLFNPVEIIWLLYPRLLGLDDLVQRVLLLPLCLMKMMPRY
jgi:hypothetical protein